MQDHKYFLSNKNFVKIFTDAQKLSIVASLEETEHEYLSVVVCRSLTYVDDGVDDGEQDDGDGDGDSAFARNPIEKLLSVYRVMQDPKVCLFITACPIFIFVNININITNLLIYLIVMVLIFPRQLKVFQAGLTSARDEAGKNFWRKLSKLLETTILVNDNEMNHCLHFLLISFNIPQQNAIWFLNPCHKM